MLIIHEQSYSWFVFSIVIRFYCGDALNSSYVFDDGVNHDLIYIMTAILQMLYLMLQLQDYVLTQNPAYNLCATAQAFRATIQVQMH